MSIANGKILEILQELNKQADMDGLPKILLDKIGYSSINNSGVDVFVQFKGSDLKFVFELGVPYGASEFKHLSCEEVFELVHKSK